MDVPHCGQVAFIDARIFSGSSLLRLGMRWESSRTLLVQADLSSLPEMQFQPMPLSRKAEPFNHPDWLFEIKWDGFRSLLHSDSDGVRLVSRNGNAFKSFPGLC